MRLRPERPGDEAAIHEVNRLAFGRGDEAKLVDELRDGGHVRLSLVAEEDGEIIGHVLFSEVSAEGVPRSLRSRWLRGGKERESARRSSGPE